MRTDSTPPIPRCCIAHANWESLARHLIADFVDIPTNAIINELSEARRASELFELGNQDALDCAELIVRNRAALLRSDALPAEI